jgi:thiamine-phosphate pyrophosphorylase
MIVISNPVSVANEIAIIHGLFEDGLAIFHLQKPHYSELEMKVFLSNIKEEYRTRLVLHHHHQLAQEFGINRVHFTESERKVSTAAELKNWKEKGFLLSTSTDNVTNFNNLDPVFDYAFLGPVFQSISKENYLPNCDFSIEIKNRTNFKSRLIALGGISWENITKAIAMGFDDVGFLGVIWNSNKPIKNFKKCQQIALLY